MAVASPFEDAVVTYRVSDGAMWKSSRQDDVLYEAACYQREPSCGRDMHHFVFFYKGYKCLCGRFDYGTVRQEYVRRQEDVMKNIKEVPLMPKAPDVAQGNVTQIPVTGWVCSRCTRVYSPSVLECPHCQPRDEQEELRK